MWVVPSVGPNDQHDLMLLFHLLLSAELRHCPLPPRAMELPWNYYAQRILNKQPMWIWEQGFPILPISPSTLKADHQLEKRQSASWDMLDSEDSIRRSMYKPQPESSQQTLNTLYWGQRWDEISLHCRESFRVLYQVAVVTMNIYYNYVWFIYFNQYIVYESVVLNSWTYVGNCLK